MFELDWGKLVVIGIVALIVIGPKELPGVLRMLGQWMAKVRRMAAEFQGQFQEAMREAEMADLKKQVDEIGAAAGDLGNVGQFDPLATPGTGAQASPTETAASHASEVGTPAPAADIAAPAVEPAPPVSEKDFTSPEPAPPKEGGERAA